MRYLLLLLLIGCGTDESYTTDLESDYIDPVLYVMVEDFVSEGLIRDVDTTDDLSRLKSLRYRDDFTVDADGDHTIAHVTWDIEGHLRIELNPDFEYGENALRFYIYHELGHGFLDLEHKDGVSNIMSASVSPEYAAYLFRSDRIRDRKLDELFKEVQ